MKSDSILVGTFFADFIDSFTIFYTFCFSLQMFGVKYRFRQIEIKTEGHFCPSLKKNRHLGEFDWKFAVFFTDLHIT